MQSNCAIRKLTSCQIVGFSAYLRAEERETSTIEKYTRNVIAFAAYLNDTPVTKEIVVAWKEKLLMDCYAPTTVNGMLASLNAFFRFAGWEDCRVKAVRLQRRAFRDASRELTRKEYEILVCTAYARGREKLGLIMETICATGIRVSEVHYITKEAVERGQAVISLKGKTRVILLPGKLRRKLKAFTQKQKITSGEVFLTRNGTGMSRRQIWAEMKSICEAAGVSRTKVFPHNLRHLFATVFYKNHRDIVKLADVLGHSSIETTRIYLISTGVEHAKKMDMLGLVS